MAVIVEVHGIRFYVVKVGSHLSKKVHNGRVYAYSYKRIVLPQDFPGDVAYVLTKEEFEKLEKLLSSCALPEVVSQFEQEPEL